MSVVTFKNEASSSNRQILSASQLVGKMFIYTRNRRSSRLEPWETSASTDVKFDTLLPNVTAVFYSAGKVRDIFKEFPRIPKYCNFSIKIL